MSEALISFVNLKYMKPVQCTAPTAANSAKKGTVYLIGAGPGAADLLTLRAARLIEQAQIVFHDALVSEEILAMAPQAVLIPVGKRCGQRSTAQHFINKQLIDAAQNYRHIVRL